MNPKNKRESAEEKRKKEVQREHDLIDLRNSDPGKYAEEIAKEKETVLITLHGENALAYRKLIRNCKPKHEKFLITKIMNVALGIGEKELQMYRKIKSMETLLNGAESDMPPVLKSLLSSVGAEVDGPFTDTDPDEEEGGKLVR